MNPMAIELSEIKKGLTWDEAVAHEATLGEGWVLPSKDLIHLVIASPRAREYMPEDCWVWTSTLYERRPNKYAWAVDFYYGQVNYEYRDEKFNARYLRLGPDGIKDLIHWCFGM